MSKSKPKLHCSSVEACYEIASGEAERYQRLANKALDSPMPASETYRLLSKRDAASRIALLIRYGPDVLGRNHTEHDEEG